jgi:MoaA/NifB/PqqE/SkfB family radical SAM enzyme
MKRPLSLARRQLGFAVGVALRRPFDVCVQLTDRCNMRCDFCGLWSRGTDAGQELTVREHERISEDLARLGTCLVSLEGGEPLLRHDLADIVRAYARFHLPVVYTNGWLVDRTTARMLFDAGLTQAGVSIDFVDPAHHDAHRGLNGAHSRAWDAVDLLREAAPHGGAQVHVMTILMRENQGEIVDLLRLSSQHRVGHHITLISPRRAGHGRGLLPDAGISARLLGLRRRYRHFATFRDYLAGIDTFVTGRRQPRCRMGRQMLNIGAAGDVTPCNEKLDWVSGNLRSEPLARLFPRVRRSPAVAECQDCWLLCRGFAHVLGRGGTVRGWIDLSTRMMSR